MRRFVRAITAPDGATAEIHQITRSDYTLAIKSRYTGHARFGTLAEIEQDAAFFERTGRLPICNTRVF